MSPQKSLLELNDVLYDSSVRDVEQYNDNSTTGDGMQNELVTCEVEEVATVNPSANIMESNASNVIPNTKAGRHSKFNAEQDIAIVREVAAAEAHLSSYGETRRRFNLVAEKLKDCPLFEQTPSWKQIQDRYKRLQDQYDSQDKDNLRLSGVGGGEMGELADLLMSMREARDDMLAQKDATKEEERKRETEKEIIGEHLMAAATSRRNSVAVDKDNEDNDDLDVLSNESSRKKRKLGRMENGLRNEMDAFGEHMKEADLARVELEQRRLDFERERHQHEREDRVTDREERKLEREAERKERREEREEERRERRDEREHQSKLELEKFKLMMDVFMKKG